MNENPTRFDLEQEAKELQERLRRMASSAEALIRDWKLRAESQRELAEYKGEKFSASGDMRHTHAAAAIDMCIAGLRWASLSNRDKPNVPDEPREK